MPPVRTHTWKGPCVSCTRLSSVAVQAVMRKRCWLPVCLAGGPALKVELRPVKSTPPEQVAAALAAAGGPRGLAGPPPRFAHSMAVLQRGGEVDVVVFGGVNQTDDLNDVAIWTL